MLAYVHLRDKIFVHQQRKPGKAAAAVKSKQNGKVKASHLLQLNSLSYSWEEVLFPAFLFRRIVYISTNVFAFLICGRIDFNLDFQTFFPFHFLSFLSIVRSPRIYHVPSSS